MKRSRQSPVASLLSAAAVVTAAVGLLAVGLVAAQEPAPSLSRTVNTYCAGCHNGRMRSPSGVLLDRFDTSDVAGNLEEWARAYRELQAGTMPPVAARRPDRAAADAALASIERAWTGQTKPAAASSEEIATRLATMLWNGVPDAALLEDAQKNRLGDSPVLEQHVRRMLANDRAQAFVARFFIPWLQLDKLADHKPSAKYFPEYDVPLREAFARETELFVLSQLRDDRDPVDLWTADYTFLNERLAKQYGVPNVAGPNFRRVALPTSERSGLLGQGSVLMLTSKHQDPAFAAYTSPATRGKWVRWHFLGVSPPGPFPGARQLSPEAPIAGQTRTLEAEPCVNCHRNFFPLGYALEHFDPIGRWRARDQVGPVDASGSFVDGTSTNGLAELRDVLLQRSEAFRTTITEKLLLYASTGSTAVSGGTPETLMRARQILRSTPKPRWSSIIAAVVQTTQS